MWGVVVELRLNRINARFVRFTITQDLAVTNTVISRHLQTLHVGASRHNCCLRLWQVPENKHVNWPKRCLPQVWYWSRAVPISWIEEKTQPTWFEWKTVRCNIYILFLFFIKCKVDLGILTQPVRNPVFSEKIGRSCQCCDSLLPASYSSMTNLTVSYPYREAHSVCSDRGSA